MRKEPWSSAEKEREERNGASRTEPKTARAVRSSTAPGVVHLFRCYQCLAAHTVGTLGDAPGLVE